MPRRDPAQVVEMCSIRQVQSLTWQNILQPWESIVDRMSESQPRIVIEVKKFRAKNVLYHRITL